MEIDFVDASNTPYFLQPEVIEWFDWQVDAGTAIDCRVFISEI